MALERVPPDLPPPPGAGPESGPETSPEIGAGEAARVEWRRRFQAAGFLDPPGSEAIWADLLRTVPPGSPFRLHLPETWRTLARASDPDLALRRWSRWIDADPGGGEPGPRARRWAESAEYREGFLLLSGASPALADELEKSWEDFSPAEWRQGWETPSSLRKRLRPLLDLPAGPPPIPTSGRRRGLEPGRQSLGQAALDPLSAAARRFRRVEELRIAYLDECRGLPVEAVTLQISWLADALIDLSLARLRSQLGPLFGDRSGSADSDGGRCFVVLALGKLGSLELNYSSDIDLLFIRDDSALPGASPEARDAVSGRLAERLIELLSAFTEEGRLYRVDTRLRPGGGVGRLVWSVSAALAYYQSEGRAWERQALIRLRPVAGDLELGSYFQAELDPFVFRRALSGEEIAELKGLKAQLERLVAERGESETHVKIGRGGIRDVEYIVQYLQLLHGAELRELKAPNVFRALEALEKRQLLTTDETDSLRRGYRFLRQVEHRIQLNYLRQTHRLPDDPADLRRIARGLGHEGVESFRARLAASSARIRRVYRRLFESAQAPAEEEERLQALLELPLSTVEKAGREYLERFGFADPDRALRLLRLLAGEESGALDQVRTRQAFRAIAPRLLREVSQYPDPDRTLANFQEFVSTLGASSVFYGLLLESEPALLLMLEVAGRSTYAIEVLRTYPALFDEVIDSMLAGHGFDRAELLAEAERIAVRIAGRISGNPSGPAAELFEFKYLHFLRIAFRDLDHTLNLTSVMHHLSEVADAVVGAALRLAERAVPREGLELSVLALGKLGGQELNYRSDLDLVFIYRQPAAAGPGEDSGEAAGAARSQERAHRLVQGVLDRLGERDRLGPLFKADVRLRPMGSKSLLAVSFEELRRYFGEGMARTWERQAFLRARPVAGDPRLSGEVMDFIRSAMPLGPEEDRAAASREVGEMRRRLEEAAGPGDFIKRGKGGIVDVEFLAQTLQLLHGRERPEVLDPNTAGAIQRLEGAGLLAPSAAADLLTSYQFLRWLETRLSLLMAPEEHLRGLDSDRLRSLIHRIGYRSSGEVPAEDIFREELAYHLRVNRGHLERVLGCPV